MNNKSSNIDYGNLRAITDKMKLNLKEKYKTLDKLASEIDKNATTSSGGSKSSGLGDMADTLDIFFNQGIYNGNIKINGGIIADYIESTEGKKEDVIDTNTVKKIVFGAINDNNKQLSLKNKLGGSSVGSLAGARISGGSISSSSFVGGTIRGASIEDPIGLDNIFDKDYVNLYSISSTRSNFDFFIQNGYNDVNFSYSIKDDDYLQLSFDKTTDVFGNTWKNSFTNSYLRSQFYNILFKPKDISTNESNQPANFKIEGMPVTIGSSNSEQDINIHGRLFVNGESITGGDIGTGLNAADLFDGDFGKNIHYERSDFQIESNRVRLKDTFNSNNSSNTDILFGFKGSNKTVVLKDIPFTINTDSSTKLTSITYDNQQTVDTSSLNKQLHEWFKDMANYLVEQTNASDNSIIATGHIVQLAFSPEIIPPNIKDHALEITFVIETTFNASSDNVNNGTVEYNKFHSDTNIDPGIYGLTISGFSITNNYSLIDQCSANIELVSDGHTKIISGEGVHINSVNKNITLKGETTIENNLSVSGTASLNGDTTITGETTIENNLSVSGTASLNGDTTITGETTIENNLSVSGTASLNGDTTITGKTTLHNVILPIVGIENITGTSPQIGVNGNIVYSDGNLYFYAINGWKKIKIDS